MAEEVTPSSPVPEVQLPTRRQAPQPLIHLQAPPEVRRVSGLTEFDRTLGGSVVHGSVVLLGGDPGIGKSTLMLQVLDRLCRQGLKGLYISGEESETQIKLRSDRLGLTSPGLLVATETCLENIFGGIQLTPVSTICSIFSYGGLPPDTL
jgi:DNA repair protein RadA/Sms